MGHMLRLNFSLSEPIAEIDAEGLEESAYCRLLLANSLLANGSHDSAHLLTTDALSLSGAVTPYVGRKTIEVELGNEQDRTRLMHHAEIARDVIASMDPGRRTLLAALYDFISDLVQDLDRVLGEATGDKEEN